MPPEISVFGALRKALTLATPTTQLQGVDDRSSWFRIYESFAGAWQSNVEVTLQNILTYSPVFGCVRLISSDIAKMRCRVVYEHESGIWLPTKSPAATPFLRKPNRYQTRIKFFQTWVISVLIHGNTYVLLERDNRGVVKAGYILDPTRVRALVAPDGSVFYALNTDNLAGLGEAVTVPASEIIHDRYLELYHPLVGVGPITACGIAAIEALRIQEGSAQFFGNGSTPGGILMAPGDIDQGTATRIENYWNTNFAGENAGKVAVLGGNLKYENIGIKAVDAQLIEQLKWTAEDVCQAFGVPPHKIGAAPAPTIAGGVEALDIQYYAQCLQERIENMEECLDFGLGLAPERIEGRQLGTEFNRDDLLQMDTAGRVSAAATAITSGLSPNEARVKYHDATPVEGGNVPFMQEQNWPISQLAARPLPTREVTPPAPIVPPAQDDETDDEDELAADDADKAALWFRKSLGLSESAVA